MDITRLQKNWDDFIERDIINPDVHPAVASSWRKCKQYGVDPTLGLGRQVNPDVFESIKDANESLIAVSLPLMRSVFDIVESSHFLLVLTDSAGYVLETMGDQAIAATAKDLRFEPGSLWSDLQVGTNALSVCLDFDIPIQMIGPEHYCIQHQGWVCSAAPIHGLNGEVIGCLDMSGDYEYTHPHTLGLVKVAAFGIEQQLLSLDNSRLMRTALDGNPESILLLDEQFRPVWANTSARKTLGIAPESLAGADFRTLLPEIDWSQVEKWDRDTRFFSSNTPLLIDGRQRYCSVNITSTRIGLNERALNVNIKMQEQVIKSVNVLSGNHASYSFGDIVTTNAAMRKTVTIAERFASYDGTVLIEGGVGSGKETFAQAIHNASARAGGPFITVNCASLPRGLVESELFGYEKGFATGALGEGYPGKIELANHGTIFLKGIDEVPLEYQGELLRVVQNRMVRRVGAAQEKELDVRVIAASTQSLRHEVERGRFRSDLFFSLNVLKLDLPPLKDRPGDIGFCAQHFLRYFNTRYPSMHKTMSDDFLMRLERYEWPGNLKELQNCIERVFYASTESVLRADELESVIGTPQDRGSLPLQAREPQGIHGPSAVAIPNLRSREDYNNIIAALDATGYQVEAAAARLGLSRASLYRRIRLLQINVKQLRRQAGV
jgi:transcriptional regulator of acetoin/glycerol metabolism